jgi:hypothetical protein
VIVREGQERKANGIGTKLLAQFNHVAKEESKKWDGCGLRSTAALILDQLDVAADAPLGLRLEKFRKGHRWLMDVVPKDRRVLVDRDIDLGKFPNFCSTGTTTKEEYLRLCGALDEKWTETAKDRESVLLRADSLMAVRYNINEDVKIFDNFSSADDWRLPVRPCQARHQRRKHSPKDQILLRVLFPMRNEWLLFVLVDQLNPRSYLHFQLAQNTLSTSQTRPVFTHTLPSPPSRELTTACLHPNSSMVMTTTTHTSENTTEVNISPRLKSMRLVIIRTILSNSDHSFAMHGALLFARFNA